MNDIVVTCGPLHVFYEYISGFEYISRFKQDENIYLDLNKKDIFLDLNRMLTCLLVLAGR